MTRAVRQSTRTPALYIQCVLVVLALCAVAYFVWGLRREHYRNFSFVSHIIFHFTTREAVLAAVAACHWAIALVVMGLTSSRNARDQRRRHWLAVISVVPAPRPELVLAESVASMVRFVCVLIVPLPLYALLIQLSGASFGIVVCLYGILVLAALNVLPVPILPMTAPAARGPLAALRMASNRRVAGAMLIPARVVVPILSVVLASMVPGLGQSRWSAHLLAPLGISSVVDLVRFQFGFAYVIPGILSRSLQFFNGSVPPWFYLLPLLLFARVAAALEVGAAVNTLEGGEVTDGGGARRAQFIGAACTYAVLFCVIGYAWRSWVSTGDTALLCGPASTILGNAQTLHWSVAGLFLLLMAPAPPMALFRVLMLPTHTRAGRPLGLAGMSRRWSKAVLRVVAPLFCLYILACLCAFTNPFPREIAGPLARVAVAVIVTAVFAAGVKRLTASMLSLVPGLAYRRFHGYNTIALCIVAGLWSLLSPSIVTRTIGAALPLDASLHVFPQVDAAVAALGRTTRPIGFAIGPLPSYAISAVLPLLTGLTLVALTGVGAVARSPVPTHTRDRSVRSPRRWGLVSRRRNRRPSPAWLALRVDNPVFLRDLAQSLPSTLLSPVLTVAVVVVVVSAFTWFDVKIDGGGFYTSFGVPLSLVNDPIALACMVSLMCVTFFTFIALAGAGLWAGERVLVDEFDKGSLGALLTTPLRDGQIVPTRIFARMIGAAASPAIMIGCSLLLVGVLSMNKAYSDFTSVWIDIQLLGLAVYFCGVGAGAIVSTLVLRARWIRGASIIVAFIATGIFLGSINVLAMQSYSSIVVFDEIYFFHLFLDCLICAVLFCAALIGAASALFRRLRRGDIDYGDQPAK